LVGQPFDTVKVRLQSSNLYNGTADAARRIAKDEGLKGFYKGTLTPLIGVGACVSIQFGVFEGMRRWYHQRHARAGQSTQLSSKEFYISGAMAGLISSFVSCPVEHIRIRLQTQVGVAKLFYGPIDCTRKIVAQGGITRLFRGQTPTMIRDAHGMGMYFLAYEACVDADIRRNHVARDQIPGFRLCGYGAVAGFAMWIAAYPIDVVKSRMQTDALEVSQQRYRSTWNCITKILQVNGWRGFLRGFTPVLLRAGPVNAATFVTFETALRFIG